MKNLLQFLYSLAFVLILSITISAHTALPFGLVAVGLALLAYFAAPTVYPRGALFLRGIENKGTRTDNTARTYQFYEHATDIAYAATINLPALQPVNEQHYYFAQLTGNATVNAPDVTKLVKGDKVLFMFKADGTARTITWGTAIKSPIASTLVVQISGSGCVIGVFDGTNICLNAN